LYKRIAEAKVEGEGKATQHELEGGPENPNQGKREKSIVNNLKKRQHCPRARESCLGFTKRQRGGNKQRETMKLEQGMKAIGE